MIPCEGHENQGNSAIAVVKRHDFPRSFIICPLLPRYGLAQSIFDLHQKWHVIHKDMLRPRQAAEVDDIYDLLSAAARSLGLRKQRRQATLFLQTVVLHSFFSLSK